MTTFKKVQGTGADLVLIHGWSCDHRHMQPIADILAPYYKVTNIDLPGRGATPWQAQIQTIHDIADIILPDLPERAVYVPWSFGGLVTLSIAARYPERVERIVGVATSPRFLEDINWPGVPAPGFRGAFSAIDDIGFYDFIEGFFQAEFSGCSELPPEYHKLIKILRESPEEDLELLLKGIDICDATDLRNEFQAVTCPIDLILGADDGSVPYSCHEQIKKLNPNVNLHVMPKAQHFPFWTYPEEFKKIIKGILC